MRTIYGNCESGDFPAIFDGAFEARYPKANRLLFGFLILDDACKAPRQNKRGEDLYAVAVCNTSDGTNPKSKPYKIRRAMLEADEYDPIDAARGVPPWEHFTERHKGGNRRILSVRVDQREVGDKAVSLVTHLKRPRDGVWECIEGDYEGPSSAPIRRFSWLLEDGSAVPLSAHNEAQLKRLRPEEAQMWVQWNQTRDEHLEQWRDNRHALVELTPDQFAALKFEERVRYRIALYLAGLDPFRFDR